MTKMGNGPSSLSLPGNTGKQNALGVWRHPSTTRDLPQSFSATTKGLFPFYETVRQVRVDARTEPYPILTYLLSTIPAK